MIVNRVNSYNTCCNPKTNTKKTNPTAVSFKRTAQENHRVVFFHNPFVTKRKIVTLKTNEGITVQAELVKPKKYSWYLSRNGECLGTIVFSKCNDPIIGENYPDDYKNKEYLFINSLKSRQQYKGIGTELIKAVVVESIRLGLEGRVCLNASTTNPRIGTPVPFYQKLGFESSNSQTEAIIEECEKTGQKLPSNCEATTMFLPKENVLKLITH